MFARLVKPAAIKPAGSIHARIAQQTRFLATVKGSVGRKMPVTRPKATPISHDRATFTIRVCYTSAGYEEFLADYLLCRMVRFSMASLSEPSPISLVKLSSRLLLSDTPNR
jgi:hypothetical protein